MQGEAEQSALAAVPDAGDRADFAGGAVRAQFEHAGRVPLADERVAVVAHRDDRPRGLEPADDVGGGTSGAT